MAVRNIGNVAPKTDTSCIHEVRTSDGVLACPARAKTGTGCILILRGFDCKCRHEMFQGIQAFSRDVCDLKAGDTRS